MAHWYDTDGSCAYTIVGANGKVRDTTLRDARKLGYVPSVTTITGQLAKPGLDIWKQNKLLESAWFSHCHSDDISFLDYEHFKQYTLHTHKEEVEKAPKLGTEVHDNLEKHFSDLKPEKHQEVCEMVSNQLNRLLGGELIYVPEESFYCHYGFGGKIDLYTYGQDGNGVIIDFKTKNTDDPKKMVKMFDYAMQLAAYREGLMFDKARCINVYISTVDFKTIEIVEYDEIELAEAWTCFKCLLKMWQITNGIKPEVDYVV